MTMMRMNVLVMFDMVIIITISTAFVMLITFFNVKEIQLSIDHSRFIFYIRSKKNSDESPFGICSGAA